MKIAFLNWLADICHWLGEEFTDLSRHLHRCPDCGRSTFYGAPCVRREEKP